ncbi:TonB-dependent siderophore receptor [Novosphingobium sp. BL-52-GroH]|uniref:TonB-dependent siderophore receptor n=1 Tax=Novosphingobium sp. BL-52-GroH TaxID=3349877 RepID=UPI00384BAED2
MGTTVPSGTASAQESGDFHIPAGPLADAIDRFARQSGAQIRHSAVAMEGKTSAGLQGRSGVAEGLSRILAGTGLTFRQTGANSFTLEAAPQSADGAIQLGPVRVGGDGTTVGGYDRPVSGTALTEHSRSYTSAGPIAAATGLGLTLRETPQSITILTRERLDQQGITTLGDALAQAPGIFYQPAGSSVGGYAGLNSRGYAVTSIMLDGVPIPSSAIAGYAALQGLGTLNTDVYDSITVVRGATGLMTGAGDPSATIALTRKRPTDTLQAIALASYGRWDQVHAMVDLGGPLNSQGTVRARAVGSFEDGDSWKEGYNYRKYLGYGIIEADLSDRTLASLSFDFGGNNGKGGAGPYTGYALTDVDGNPTPFSRRDNAQTEWSRFRDRRIGVTAAIEHTFDEDWRAKLVYNHNEVKTRQYFGLAADLPDADGFTALHLRSYRITNKVDSVGAKLDGAYYLFGRRHELVAGFNGSWTDEITPDWYRSFASTVNVYSWNRQFPEPDWESLYGFGWGTKVSQYGAYVATRFRATEALAILGGLRWSNWRTRDLDETGADYDDRKYRNEITPYLGAVLDITPNLSIYASYTSIFNPQSSRDVQGRLLDPETGSNIEAGIKGEWFDGRLNASAAVFQVKKDNLAVQDGTNLTPTGDQAYVAIDDTKGRGWEVEISGEPVEGWSVQGGYTRVRTKDSAGARLNGEMPEHMVKLFTSWTAPSLSQLTVGGGVTWQSRIYSPWMDEAWADRYAQRSYAVVNAMVRYAISEQIMVTVNANNLFDKVYRTDVDVHDYGAPRSFVASVRAQF